MPLISTCVLNSRLNCCASFEWALGQTWCLVFFENARPCYPKTDCIGLWAGRWLTCWFAGGEFLPYLRQWLVEWVALQPSTFWRKALCAAQFLLAMLVRLRCEVTLSILGHSTAPYIVQILPFLVLVFLLLWLVPCAKTPCISSPILCPPTNNSVSCTVAVDHRLQYICRRAVWMKHRQHAPLSISPASMGLTT